MTIGQKMGLCLLIHKRSVELGNALMKFCIVTHESRFDGYKSRSTQLTLSPEAYFTKIFIQLGALISN